MHWYTVSTSDTLDCFESICPIVQHVENGHSSDVDNFDHCHQPDYVLYVPCCLETSLTDRTHTAVCPPSPSSFDILESSNSQHFVVPRHVVKFIHSSPNSSFVSLFPSLLIMVLILLALVIYVVFLKRMKHRSGSSVKIKVCCLIFSDRLHGY